MKKLAVVAFGGNALLRPGEKGTINEQERNVYETCEKLLGLVKRGYDIVITHGNGPQVGNILLQNQAGAEVHGIPEMPLDICGAYSQGFIGYMIEQQFRNVLKENNIDKNVITIITQVLVDKNDPAFKKPTKPIGPFYSKEDAKKISVKTGYLFKEDPDGVGWRKVVASPIPKLIFNRISIEKLAREGQIIIAGGGGGIPVFYVEPNKLKGIEAVIDKDLTSSMLASQINADEFYVFTDLPKINTYSKESNKNLDVITVKEAKKYLSEGYFSEGGMAPKIKAAINFVENGGKECILIHMLHKFDSRLNDSESETKIVP